MLRPLLALMICLSTGGVWAEPGKATISGKGKPHLFMENKGQIHGPDNQPLPQVLYQLAGGGINVSLTAQSIHYTFITQVESKADSADKRGLNSDPVPTRYETVGMDVVLIGANPVPHITAEEQQEYYESYYTSIARKQGRTGITDIHSYAKLVFHDIYPHIDWVIYVPSDAAGSSVKYDFVVRTGGNPADIRLKYDGATALSLNNDGSLEANTELGSIKDIRPYSYIRESRKELGPVDRI